jgi:hypothetical protein
MPDTTRRQHQRCDARFAAATMQPPLLARLIGRPFSCLRGGSVLWRGRRRRPLPLAFHKLRRWVLRFWAANVLAGEVLFPWLYAVVFFQWPEPDYYSAAAAAVASSSSAVAPGNDGHHEHHARSGSSANQEILFASSDAINADDYDTHAIVVSDPQLTDAYSYGHSGLALWLEEFYCDLYAIVLCPPSPPVLFEMPQY